jgi:hypothetical protein
MDHICNTPHPELETDSNGDDLHSEILAIFHLSTLPGWVYVAMTGDSKLELFYDIDALVNECPVVVQEDMATTHWDDDHIVLLMGTGHPIFYKTFGHEFQQTFLSLAHPPKFYSTRDSFLVNEWICISHPGTYWGDVGFVCTLSDDEEEDHITILLVPQITDDVNLAIYLWEHVHPPLRKELWPHTSDDPPLSGEGEEKTWVFGRDRMTKDGMLLRSFAPWELRKDMVDGANLYLLPEQDIRFCHHLSPDHWPQMPPMYDPHHHFM